MWVIFIDFMLVLRFLFEMVTKLTVRFVYILLYAFALEVIMHSPS